MLHRLGKLDRSRLAIGVALIAFGVAAVAGLLYPRSAQVDHSDVSSQSRKGLQRYTLTPAEWDSLTIRPVTVRSFREEHVTEGMIAVDENRSTPVFSPYSGRVIKLLAQPGDSVVQGQPLFVIEAADNVRVQSECVAAMTDLNKAKSALEFAQLQDKRAKDLFEARAVPLKDYQQSQAALIQAENDLRSSQAALEAAHNKLRLLGFTDEAIATFQKNGSINPETTIYAPIAGTVVQRKVGPGQYVNAGASDPVFVIGDLSTIWLTAFVRESEAASVAVGQELTFSLAALSGRILTGRVDYIAAAIDPATRRLPVRATIDNTSRQLKPGMFATVTIHVPGDQPSISVPKVALIHEGDLVRVWVVHEDRSIELRQIETGIANGDLVEVKGNLMPGELIVTKGSLFIDRPHGS